MDPSGGGPVEGLKQVSALLSRHGHRIEVASLDAPDAPGVADFPLALHTLGPGWGGYGYSPNYVPWLRERGGDFDAVIVHGLWQYHSFGVWRALRDGRIPYFVYPHGMLDPWFNRQHPLKHLKKLLYWPWAESRVLRDARAVLFTCERERDLARESFQRYRCCERVVSYGTASPVNDATSQKRLFAEAHPQLCEKRLILFLGRVHEKKGVDLLLRAFAQFNSGNGENYRLVIAGPGAPALLAKLRKLASRLGIADRVTWTGLLQGEIKWGALRTAEVFALPSHQENFGIAVAEALACGLPVLISDKVNICNEIEKDGAGLVAADNLEGSINVMLRWRALPEPAKSQMRVRARECFVKRYEIGRVADHLLETLRESGVGA